MVYFGILHYDWSWWLKQMALKELYVGDLVRLLFSNSYGVIVEKSTRSLPDEYVVYSYFVHYSDGRHRWEIDEAIEFVARG